MASIATPASLFTADGLLRTFRRDEVCERLGGSLRSLDRMLARGELKTVPGTRGKGLTTLITAGSLYQYIYGGER